MTIDYDNFKAEKGRKKRDFLLKLLGIAVILGCVVLFFFFALMLFFPKGGWLQFFE